MAARKTSTASRPAVRNQNVGAAADVLGQLAALAPTAAKPTSKTGQKWELPLDDEAKVYATRWLEAKTVGEPITKRMETSKDEFSLYALRQMSERLFNNKSKPSNPEIILRKPDGTVDHRFQFMMTDKFKYRFPPVPENTESRDHFISVFTSLGLHPNDATRLVDEELDFNPIVAIRNLTELLEGYYGEGREWIDSSAQEKEAGRKLAALLMWMPGAPAPEALTPEEKAMIVQRNPGIQVKAGFYGRVATYVRSVDQLMAVFSVIVPIAYPAYAKFAINDTPTDQTQRKIEAAAAILGITDAAVDE